MKQKFNFLFLSLCMTLFLLIPMYASAESSTNYTYVEKETENLPNHSIELAEELPYNTIKVQGCAGENDGLDYYKVTIPTEGSLNVTFKSISNDSETLVIKIYKATKSDYYSEIYSHAVWDANKTQENTLYLSPGDYYFRIELTSRNTKIDGRYFLDLIYTPTEDIDITEHNSLTTAFLPKEGENYTGFVAVDEQTAYHIVTLDYPGVVDLNVSSYSTELNYQCSSLRVDGDYLWEGNFVESARTTNLSNSGKYTLNRTLYLDAGTYIFSLRNPSSVNRHYLGFEYKISYAYQPVKHVPIRPLTWEEPSVLSFDKKTLGFVSQLNSPNKYYYKLTLPTSGLLSLNFKKLMNTDVNDYNSNHIITIYEGELDANGNRVAITQETENLYLKQGSYYIEVDKSRGHRGSYSLTPSFVPSNVSYENNNFFETAAKISIGELVTGQFSINDKQDVYFFELAKNKELSIKYTNNLTNYSTYFLCDAYENTLSAYSFDASAIGKTYSGTWNLGTLKAGKYYIFKNNHFYGSNTANTVGTYEFQLITGTTKPVDPETVVPTPVTTKSISLNKTTLSILKGKTYTLKATVTPSNAVNKAVTWKSSNSKVVSVNSKGLITAKAAGKATITVTTNDTGKKATCTITVNNPVKTKKVSLSRKTLSLIKGKTYTLKATVTPSNATNKAVTWKSSNKNVVTVTSSGKLIAKKYGKATITVTTKDTGKKTTCVVTVRPDAPKKVSLKKSSNTLKLSWKKISDVTGYKIYRSTKKNSGYKLVKTIAKPSITVYSTKLSSLKKKTTYYYKIVAYKTVKSGSKNVTIISDYSSSVSVKR